MLDGYSKEGVIVGQNWGSSSSIIIDDTEEEDRSNQQAKRSAMVDMIQAAHQAHPSQLGGSYSGFFHPGSGGGGGGDEFDRRSAGYIPSQWPNPFLKYYHTNSREGEGTEKPLDDLASSKIHVFQREIEISSATSAPDLKILFPKSSSLVRHHERKKKKRLVDGDDDPDLLSLRPPNSAHSDTTTTTTATNASSSPDRESSIIAHNQSLFHKPAQVELPRPNHIDLPRLDPPGHHQALGLELLNVLLECAQAVHRQDLDSATTLLAQLKHGASVYGDSMQRLTAHFAEGLATRILHHRHSATAAQLLPPAKLDLLHSLILHRPAASPAAADDHLAAFTALYKVSPFFKLAHFTANQAIVEAVAGRARVHVIDLDILQGFQWPSFIQALASRSGGPPSLLTLTGIGSSAESLRDTGNRLSSFAAMFGVPFRFQPLVVGSLEELDLGARIEPRTGNGEVDDMEEEEDEEEEAVAVNAVFQLHRLLNAPRESRKLERFLAGLRRIRPAAVTVVEQEAAHNAPDFIARFVEALHYYAAVFDSLDASLPQRDEERVRIEQVMFAAQIKNIVSCEGAERIERHEKMGFWAGKMGECGFAQAPMSSHSVSQAKLLLQLCPCDGYRVVESPCEGWPVGSISLGWQQRLLLTASTWGCA
ncbi:DELLA protein GAI [Selaginella moellendorffii]|nr:DELLA protein GAI [Selaginella moellendorffii]|eukprot:XP_002977371.2 DELLA protein GAI [Selaginella moellendorffii]